MIGMLSGSDTMAQTLSSGPMQQPPANEKGATLAQLRACGQ